MKQKNNNKDFLNEIALGRIKDIMCFNWENTNQYPDGVTIHAEHEVSPSKKQLDAKLKMLTVKSVNAVAFSTNASGGRSCFIDQNIAALSNSATKPSLFVFDSDVELYCRHAKSLEKLGYKVALLDFEYPNNSDKWNPYSTLVWRIKLIRELSNELENRDGKYYGVGEMFRTYKDVRTRLDEIRNELYEAVDFITEQLFYHIVESDECAIARKLISAFTIAICEDCIASQLGVSQLILTNVCQNLLHYCKNDSAVLKGYLVDKRNKHSKAKAVAQEVYEGRSPEDLQGIMESVIRLIRLNCGDGVMSATCENWIDIFCNTDSPTAVFILLRKKEGMVPKYVNLFFSQSYKAREEVMAFERKKMGYIEPKALRPFYYIVNGYDVLPNIKFDCSLFSGENGARHLILIAKSYTQLLKKYGEKFSDWLKADCSLKLFLSVDDLESRKEYCELCCSHLGNEAQAIQSLKEIEMFDKVNGVGNAVVSLFDKPPFTTRFTPSYKILSLICPEGERREPDSDDSVSYWGSCFDISKQLLKLNLGDVLSSGDSEMKGDGEVNPM